MKISIIICTYNRSKYLVKLLENLSSLRNDGSFEYEIIIVDNNSTDSTKDIVGSFILKNDKIKYVLESKKGASNARNAGINIAKGEILAFTDDDVVIDNDWVQNIFNFSKEHDFDAVGGRVLLLLQAQTPQWIIDHQDIIWGPVPHYDHGETIKLYDPTMNSFVGANMIIKKKVFKEVGGFDTSLGPGTEITMVGEDTALFDKMRRLNKKIFYNPNILIHHPIEKDRITLKFIAKWGLSFGNYLVVTNKDQMTHVCYFGIPRYLYHEILTNLLSMPFLLFEKHKFVRCWRTLFIRIGMIQAYRKNKRTS